MSVVKGYRLMRGGLMLMAILGAVSAARADMMPMEESDLDEVSGQASLFSVDYTAPGQNGNPNSKLGFYRLSIDAEISMNANIDRLALGCGGSKGAGKCDLDINEVRLTGTQATASGDTGPGTDAILTRPFFEFAIKNPDLLSSREITGIRFGAEKALGKMTIGQNPDITNREDDYGVVNFSGDMDAYIAWTTLNNVKVTLFGGTLGTASAELDPYQYSTKHSGNPLIFDRAVGTWTTHNTCASTGDCMYFDGLSGTAKLFGFNIALKSNLYERLAYIHDLMLSEDIAGLVPVRGMYLSLQKETIFWPKVDGSAIPGFHAIPARKGWWMSVPQVTIPHLVIEQELEVDALDALGTVNLEDLDLGQVPVDNCYGSLKFC